jgi:hypothetical protein
MAMRGRPLAKRYIAFDDHNFDFSQKEVRLFDDLIRRGYDVTQIARLFARSQIEVFLLYLDRVEKKRIDPIYSLRLIERDED